ncbi:hypothetical protein OESDEN_05203 [Oesophagostomum dentatum]|uniref:Uncharacterized protein n=1 Tax=Oesophagostomum dentatum TaxID=61180 RepID=A0A0B1THG7_OESDE|nr:hypothetical protein OESDEN_05203 [Oesophagostomum dentatum]
MGGHIVEFETTSRNYVSGTSISAFSVWCCADPRCETKMTSFCKNLLAAFLQVSIFYEFGTTSINCVSGTSISAFSVWCCADPRCETKMNSFCTNLLAAFLQLITCPIIVGFVWSVMWGVLFIQIARKWFISSIDNRYSMLDVCPCSRW